MKFILNKDILEIENIEVVKSGSVNYYEADVEYDESWNGLVIEAVMLKKDEDAGVSIAVINNKMYIDQKLRGTYCIGFVGYKIEEEKKTYQVSTNLQKVYFDLGAGEIETENEEIPTPTEWEIYNAQIQEFIREGQAVVDEAKASGDYSKEQGTYAKEQGDYAKQEAEKVDSVVEYVTRTSEEAKDIAETAESIAKGANQCKTYGDYPTFIEDFNLIPKDKYSVGQDVRIVQVEVPDIWVAYIEEESVEYVYTTDEAFVNELITNGTVQVGYYKFGMLETQKVNLKDYVKNTDYATLSNAGVVKNGGAIFGIQINNSGIPYIEPATDTDIEQKTSHRKPIVPANLDLAVGSVKASETQFGTIKTWTSINENGEIGLNISTEV